jgi:hypothetical protein
MRKNELLKNSRRIGFEMIEVLIEDNQTIDIIKNINYPNQRIFIFNIDDYIVSVPFIESEEEIFLKAEN